MTEDEIDEIIRLLEELPPEAPDEPIGESLQSIIDKPEKPRPPVGHRRSIQSGPH
jgi:hypothetical protein